MIEHSVSSGRYARAIVVSVLGVILVWQVVTRSFVAYWASAAPQIALALAPANPEALLNLTDSHLVRRLEAARRAGAARASPGLVTSADSSQDPTDRTRAWAEVGARSRAAEQAGPATPPAGGNSGGPMGLAADDQLRAWAELALLNDPLSARAMRILGQLAAVAGDEPRTMEFMQAAATRSMHERLPIYLLMLKGIEKKDYAAALYYADALLRTTPQAIPDAMPALVHIAETPAATGELKAMLAKNPPWRAGFLSQLPSSVSDARTPLELLLAIKDTPTPPTTEDLGAYLNFLVSKNQYELAYYAWLQFLSTEQLHRVGLLYNGSFEANPSGLPFDWNIPSGAGVTIDIVGRPDLPGQRALLMTFAQGRVEFRGVAQLIMLSPGNYQFKGTYRGQLTGRRGLAWRVTCAGAGKGPIGESPMIVGSAPVWKDIEFSFTVPETDCRAQLLRLELDARMASEQLVTGSIWHDELRIARISKN